MIKLKQLFKKLVNSVKKVFIKDKLKTLPEGNFQYETAPAGISLEELRIKEENELYENVKTGKIPLNSLLITDLVKVLAISKEELNVEDESFKKLKTEGSLITDKLKLLENARKGLLNINTLQ